MLLFDDGIIHLSVIVEAHSSTDSLHPYRRCFTASYFWSLHHNAVQSIRLTTGYCASVRGVRYHTVRDKSALTFAKDETLREFLVEISILTEQLRIHHLSQLAVAT